MNNPSTLADLSSDERSKVLDVLAGQIRAGKVRLRFDPASGVGRKIVELYREAEQRLADSDRSFNGAERQDRTPHHKGRPVRARSGSRAANGKPTIGVRARRPKPASKPPPGTTLEIQGQARASLIDALKHEDPIRAIEVVVTTNREADERSGKPAPSEDDLCRFDDSGLGIAPAGLVCWYALPDEAPADTEERVRCDRLAGGRNPKTGLPEPKPNRVAAAEMRRDGLGTRAIAHALNVSHQTVARWFRGDSH